MNPSLPSILSVTCALMSLLTFLLMAADKSAAKRRARRIPEKILFLFVILFGAPGGLLAMLLCRHKTRHVTFALGFPLLALTQIALLLLLHV